MYKSKTVIHFVDYGKEYKVIKIYGSNNQYRIYHLFNTIENGRPKAHKKQMEKYADLTSCFYWFINNNIGNY